MNATYTNTPFMCNYVDVHEPAVHELHVEVRVERVHAAGYRRQHEQVAAWGHPVRVTTCRTWAVRFPGGVRPSSFTNTCLDRRGRIRSATGMRYSTSSR